MEFTSNFSNSSISEVFGFAIVSFENTHQGFVGYSYGQQADHYWSYESALNGLNVVID
jgi:hypothetical protein